MVPFKVCGLAGLVCSIHSLIPPTSQATILNASEPVSATCHAQSNAHQGQCPGFRQASMSPEEISAYILQSLVRQAEETLGEEVDGAVGHPSSVELLISRLHCICFIHVPCSSCCHTESNKHHMKTILPNMAAGHSCASSLQ